jgi:3-hydroxyacyl-[acyl-carrier-protein] dehydratase
MPPQPLIDLAKLDTNKVIVDRNGIYSINPHRFEFMLLDGINYLNREENVIVGYRDNREDDFWVKAHIPGRPIFPGVLMIESAAQLVSYYVMSRDRDKGFLGFGGVTDVKFRGSVTPGQRIVLIGKMVEDRPRRCIGATQGFVNGQMVYEGLITGMWL